MGSEWVASMVLVHGITELTQMRYAAILILEFALLFMINQALLKFRKNCQFLVAKIKPELYNRNKLYGR